MDPIARTSPEESVLELAGRRRRHGAAPETLVDGVFVTYLLGYALGRGIGALWMHGPASEQGVRRLVHGAADLAHRHHAA